MKKPCHMLSWHSYLVIRHIRQESPAVADKPVKRKSMPNIAPIQRERSGRKVNDLFEVMTTCLK